MGGVPMAGLRRGFVALSTLLLVGSVSTPISTATTPPPNQDGNAFAHGLRIKKEITGHSHIRSLAAAAAVAAAHPRPAKHPRLPRPWVNVGKAATATRSTSVSAGVR